MKKIKMKILDTLDALKLVDQIVKTIRWYKKNDLTIVPKYKKKGFKGEPVEDHEQCYDIRGKDRKTKLEIYLVGLKRLHLESGTMLQ